MKIVNKCYPPSVVDAVENRSSGVGDSCRPAELDAAVEGFAPVFGLISRLESDARLPHVRRIMNPPAGNITSILNALGRGDECGSKELVLTLYAELRRIAASKMARQQPGHTLQATALVHEAWMRLVDTDGRARFENRAHFFAAAAEAMRCILVDHARRKHCSKRGGGVEHCDLDDVDIAAPMVNRDELLAVDEALNRLQAHDARKAELVKLRYFVGLSVEKAAEVLGISVPTANRYWAYARAWLHADITRGAQPGSQNSLQSA